MIAGAKLLELEIALRRADQGLKGGGHERSIDVVLAGKRRVDARLLTVNGNGAQAYLQTRECLGSGTASSATFWLNCWRMPWAWSANI